MPKRVIKYIKRNKHAEKVLTFSYIIIMYLLFISGTYHMRKIGCASQSLGLSIWMVMVTTLKAR